MKLHVSKMTIPRTSLVVEWLGLSASTAEGTGLTPGWETKITPSEGAFKPTHHNKRPCLLSETSHSHKHKFFKKSISLTEFLF